MERIETWKIIKGRIGETIAEEMLRELGFFVMKLGKEHTANPLDQLKNFVESCGGKFKLEKLGMEIREISHINVLPDFVIVSPKNGKVQLIEVKYRWDAELYDRDLMVFKTYPEAHMLVINTEVSEKIREISEKESANKEDLMKSRFHIWTNKQNLKDYYILVYGLLGSEYLSVLPIFYFHQGIKLYVAEYSFKIILIALIILNV